MSDTLKGSFFRDQLPAIVWAIVIFIGSSIPSDDFPDMSIFQYDKLIHITIFYIFGLCIYRAFSLFWVKGRFSWSRGLFTLLTVSIYGVVDEFHQRYVPGRTADVWDATADTIGCALAVVSIYLYMSNKGGKTLPQS